MKLLLFGLLFFPLLAQAQLAPNMVKVCDEICTVTAAPANAVYQFGTGTSFSAPMTQSLPLFASCADPCPWFGGDPDVGIYKTLYVQQQTTAFTVTWNNASGTVTTAIPGLPTAQVAVSATATVTTKDQPITTASPVIPAGTTICNVPKNGGACKNSVPITLAPLKATVPAQTAPVTVSGQGFALSCPTVPTTTQPSVSGCTLTVTQ